MTWKNEMKFGELSWGTPIVYGWFRGENCLYIGMSICGLSRPLQSKHHVIGRVMARKTDKLCWSEYETIAHARAMEKFLIRNLCPKYNGNALVRFMSKKERYKHELALL